MIEETKKRVDVRSCMQEDGEDVSCYNCKPLSSVMNPDVVGTAGFTPLCLTYEVRMETLGPHGRSMGWRILGDGMLFGLT